MWLFLNNRLSILHQVFPCFLFSVQIRQPWDWEPRYCRCRDSRRQTVRQRPREKAKERPPVGKSLGLSVVSTTKADSHFVLICWPIMMKNEQGNHRVGPGREGMLNICFQKFWFWVELGWTEYPFCQIETPAVPQMGSVIWSHLVYYVWPQKSLSLFDPIIWKLVRKYEGFLHFFYVVLHG